MGFRRAETSSVGTLSHVAGTRGGATGTRRTRGAVLSKSVGSLLRTASASIRARFTKRDRVDDCVPPVGNPLSIAACLSFRARGNSAGGLKRGMMRPECAAYAVIVTNSRVQSSLEV